MDFINAKRKQDNYPSTVISLVNQKGGVGKTTSSINLTSALANKGYKVLLLDFDPQGNASSGVGVDRSMCENTIYEAILDSHIDTKDCIYETEFENIWVCPSNIDLVAAETELGQEDKPAFFLKQAIKDIKDYFDYIIVDCPPSLGQLTVNALVASDCVIIPVQCEFFALEGLSKITKTINIVSKGYNKNLVVLGVLFTMYEGRRNLTKQITEQVNQYFKEKVFKTKIPRSVKFAEAPSHGVPIDKYSTWGKGIHSYEDLAKEVVKRNNKRLRSI
ncbi:MAG: AAA family ATPase [Coriobacteriales bacterium]|nr:AAA family ATPase [Coriobacteriales bacterium]